MAAGAKELPVLNVTISLLAGPVAATTDAGHSPLDLKQAKALLGEPRA